MDIVQEIQTAITVSRLKRALENGFNIASVTDTQGRTFTGTFNLVRLQDCKGNLTGYEVQVTSENGFHPINFDRLLIVDIHS